jgi:hypothetical protein
MNDDRPTALLDRAPAPSSSVEQAHQEGPAAVPTAGTRAGSAVSAPVRGRTRTRGPRRWNDPDEKLMIQGMLAVAGLSVYAAVFITLAVWLTG